MVPGFVAPNTACVLERGKEQYVNFIDKFEHLRRILAACLPGTSCAKNFSLRDPVIDVGFSHVWRFSSLDFSFSEVRADHFNFSFLERLAPHVSYSIGKSRLHGYTNSECR